MRQGTIGLWDNPKFVSKGNFIYKNLVISELIFATRLPG
jgi:hypothetical protein